MILFVCRWEHVRTVRAVTKTELSFRCMSYDRLFAKRTLPLATYVFSDIDRLSVWELEVAALIYRELQAAGAPVYNDPARVLQRFDLLKALHREGINAFNVYRPHRGEWPDRYPVFVRRDAFHKGVLTDLLHSRAELEQALEAVLADGIPLVNTMVVEFEAEPVGPGLYRKYSAYRIGDRYFQETSVNERNWVVKHGEINAAGDGFYEDELDTIDSVRHEATIRKAFEIASIEYGRVDYGVSKGEAQVFEINTNPKVSYDTSHPNAARARSREIFVRNYRDAITALEAKDLSGGVTIQNELLEKLRRRARWRGWGRSRPSI